MNPDVSSTLCVMVCVQGIYESQQSCTSGSGSGAPLLAQRTVAANIHLYEIIGQLMTLTVITQIIYRLPDAHIRLVTVFTRDEESFLWDSDSGLSKFRTSNSSPKKA